MSARVVASSFALVLLCAVGSVQAQDPVKVAPHVLLVELKGQ